MNSNQQARQREQQTLERMLRLYCRAHHSETPLCRACFELLAYAKNKVDACPHGVDKPTCQQCTIHCYDAEQREHIRTAMRYAGPRMLVRYPLDAIRHLWRSIRH